MSAWSGLAGVCAGIAVALGPPAGARARLRRLRPWAGAGVGLPRLLHAAVRGHAERVRQAIRSRAEPGGADDVVALLESFAAELRAGAMPEAALERSVGDVAGRALADDLRQVVGMVRLGASGPAALRTVADGRHRELGWLAAGWELADARGLSLAPVTGRIAAAARDQAEHRLAVRAELAGSRASVRMLAALPAVGLALGAALGADPVRVLFSGPAGAACLACACLLELAGLRWTAAIVRRAEEAGR